MPQLLAAQEISEARHLAEHVAELFAKARSVANLFQGSQLVAGNVQNNSVIESRQLPRNVENTLVFSNIFQFFFFTSSVIYHIQELFPVFGGRSLPQKVIITFTFHSLLLPGFSQFAARVMLECYVSCSPNFAERKVFHFSTAPCDASPHHARQPRTK